MEGGVCASGGRDSDGLVLRKFEAVSPPSRVSEPLTCSKQDPEHSMNPCKRRRLGKKRRRKEETVEEEK